MQKKPNTKLQDLLKIKSAKTRKLSELFKTEQNRLAKLNAMLHELRRGENVQNRRLGLVSSYPYPEDTIDIGWWV